MNVSINNDFMIEVDSPMLRFIMCRVVVLNFANVIKCSMYALILYPISCE